MYTEEEKKSIDWKNIFKKGLIIVLVAAIIFLIIWLFARNNTPNIKVNTGDANNSLNTDAYSNIFIDNYRYFHDTAKEYFLISELPENGKSIKYTLKELIDKGLILPFGYTDKESCDYEASYVIVTNNNGKYTYSVTLVCGREAAKTTEELGCNQLCTNGSCTPSTPSEKPSTTPSDKLALEYRYKQSYVDKETLYSCPDGYTKTGTGSSAQCIKGTKDTIAATKNVKYLCPDGYTKTGTGSSTQCVKKETKTIDATKNVTYSCPQDYVKTGSGDNTQCYKTTKESVNPTITYTYSCPSGYNKTGTGLNLKCTKTTEEKIDAKVSYTYNCPDGYTKSGSGTNTKCSKVVPTKSTQTISPICPEGYDQSGSGSSIKCSKTVPNTTTQTDKPKFSSYYCEKGTNLNNGKCRIYNTTSYYITTYIDYGPYYNGCTFSGAYTNKCNTAGCVSKYYKYYCSKSAYNDVDATAIYKCPSGYSPSGNVSANTTCTKTVTTNTTKTANPICPKGYDQSGSGSNIKCSKIVESKKTEYTDYIKKTTYSCSEGKLSGTKCIFTKTLTTDSLKTTNYSCKDGYVLNGNKCYKTTEKHIAASKNTTYTCQEGYTKNGKKCTYDYNITQNATKNTTYTCPSGYTKYGTGSSSTCTKGNVSYTNPTTSSKSVTKYRYQWSPETSIPGWERTGETRQVPVK